MAAPNTNFIVPDNSADDVPMHVLMTIASLAATTGGPARSVPLLANALAEMGVEVGVLTTQSRDGDTIAVPLDARVRLWTVPGWSSLRWRLQWAPEFGRGMTQLLTNPALRPRIIHDCGVWLPTNHAVAVAARRFRVPRVISPRGMLVAAALRHRAWKKKLAWWLYQRRDVQTAALLHATADDEARDLRALNLRPPVVVVPNGVQVPDLSVWPRLTKTPTTERTVLFLSRLSPTKGLKHLIDAWITLRPARWRLRIAGPDEAGLWPPLRHDLERHGLAPTVEYLGAVAETDKWALYRQADLFVFPALGENFGLTVAEALACEVPVIASHGVPWRGLIERRCGWWVPVGTTPLVAALRSALAISDSERTDMGRRGRDWIEREFQWSAIARQMVALYRQVAPD